MLTKCYSQLKTNTTIKLDFREYAKAPPKKRFFITMYYYLLETLLPSNNPF